jgi:hypothetical protein
LGPVTSDIPSPHSVPSRFSAPKVKVSVPQPPASMPQMQSHHMETGKAMADFINTHSAIGWTKLQLEKIQH